MHTTYFLLRKMKLKARHIDANIMPNDPRQIMVIVRTGWMVTNSSLGIPSVGTNPKL